MKREEILKRIKEHKEAIKSFGAKRLTLFGSYARNQAHEDSDIDFLVEFELGRGLFDDYYGLLRFLENLLGKRVDLVKPSLVREELQESIFGGAQIEA